MRDLKIQNEVKLPTGYTIEWGGTFEHFESGRNRLLVVLPVHISSNPLFAVHNISFL